MPFERLFDGEMILGRIGIDQRECRDRAVDDNRVLAVARINRRAVVDYMKHIVIRRAGNRPISRDRDLLTAERGVFMIRRNFSDNQIGARRFFDKHRGVNRIGVVDLGAVHDEAAGIGNIRQIDSRVRRDCR